MSRFLRPILVLAAAMLTAGMAQAQETISPQRMGERIFLFHDLKADLVAQARFITMIAPMEQRLEVRQGYTLALNGLDMAKLRERFGKELAAKLSPEEVTLLYRHNLERRMLIADKLAKVRADIVPIKAAFTLHLMTGFDGLGEFAIEHPPQGVPEAKIEALIGILAKAGEAQGDMNINSHDAEVASMVPMGMTKEQAESMVNYWMTRITVALVHSMAKHLTEVEAKPLLEARADPKLAKVLDVEEALLEEFRERTTNELLAKMRKAKGR